MKYFLSLVGSIMSIITVYIPIDNLLKRIIIVNESMTEIIGDLDKITKIDLKKIYEVKHRLNDKDKKGFSVKIFKRDIIYSITYLKKNIDNVINDIDMDKRKILTSIIEKIKEYDKTVLEWNEYNMMKLRHFGGTRDIKNPKELLRDLQKTCGIFLEKIGGKG